MASVSPAPTADPNFGRVLVGTVGSEVFLQVEGRGTHLISQPLREFLTAMFQRGHRTFCLDLGRCLYLDSTFLGVLASTCLKLRAVEGRFSVAAISPKNLELLRT